MVRGRTIKTGFGLSEVADFTNEVSRPTPCLAGRAMSSLRGLLMVALIALGTGCAEASSEDAVSTNAAISDDIQPTRSAVGTLVAGTSAAGCTGTLISANVVLTAADCVSGTSKLDFVLGAEGAEKHFAATASGDSAHPFTHVHPSFAGDRHNLAYVILAASVPPNVAKPARVGSHANVADCAFAVRAGEDGAIKTANICLTGTQPSTGLLTATENADSDSCVGASGGGLLLRGSATDVLVGIVGGVNPCTNAQMLFTPLASESAFIQQAFAAGSRARSSVSFDD